MKVSEQYFPAMLFIMLDKVVLTLESVNEILKCNGVSIQMKVIEQYFLCGIVDYVAQIGFNV